MQPDIRAPEEQQEAVEAAIALLATTPCRDCKDETEPVEFYRPVKGTKYPLVEKAKEWSPKFTELFIKRLVPLCVSCAANFKGEPKLFGDWNKLPGKVKASRYKWLALTTTNKDKQSLYWMRYHEELEA